MEIHKKSKMKSQEQLDNHKAISLKKEIAKLELKRDKLQSFIFNEKEKLQNICLHNETYEKHEFFEGSYYDKSEYINKMICEVCGKVMSENKSYGGYG